MRVHHFTGGNLSIKIRSIEVTVHIESLRREVSISSGSNRNWNDPNGLRRAWGADFVFFKNGVTCNRTVTVEEGGENKTYRAGEVIWGGRITVPTSQSFVFKEVDDSAQTYSVPGGSAVAAPGSVPKISARYS